MNGTNRTGFSLRGTASKRWARPQVPKDYGAIPREVLKRLASERLPDKESYTRRLNELLLKGENHGEH